MSVQHLVAHSPVGFVVAFGAGMASFLSPCVLPLVPSYLSLMSGLTATELSVGTGGGERSERPDTATGPDTTTPTATGPAADGGAGTATPTGAGPAAGRATATETATSTKAAVQKSLLRSALLFVAGFTVVFAAVEAGASALGRTLQKHQAGLTEVAGVVIIIMGLAFAGVIRPAWLQRERRFHISPSKLGNWAPPVMGMAFAFGWTPCIGPSLGAVIALSNEQSTLGRGELMLLCYSLGLGVPFVVCGVAFGRLTGLFAWVKRHLRVVNLVSGLLLAGLGILLLTDSIHRLSNWFTNLPGLNQFNL